MSLNSIVSSLRKTADQPKVAPASPSNDAHVLQQPAGASVPNATDDANTGKNGRPPENVDVQTKEKLPKVLEKLAKVPNRHEKNTIEDQESALADLMSQLLDPNITPNDTRETQYPAPEASDRPRRQRIERKEEKRPKKGLLFAATGVKELLRPLDRLNNRRISVAGLRYRLREARTRLKNSRDALDERETRMTQELIRILRRGGQANLKILSMDQEQLQAERDKFRQEESWYDTLEEQLANEEWDLREVERLLYGELVDWSGNSQTFTTTSTLQTEISSASGSTGTEIPDVQSSLTERWATARQERQEILKRLEEIAAERELLWQEQETRTRAGLNLDIFAEDVLRTSAFRQGELEYHLATVEDQITWLRDALQDKKDIYFSMDQFSSNTGYPDTYTLDDQGDPLAEFSNTMAQESKSFRTSDNTLALRVDDASRVFSAKNDYNRSNFISTIDYIDDWLLYTLRTSIREMVAFKSSSKLLPFDFTWDRLRELILQWWFKDEATILFSESEQQGFTFDPSILTNTVRTPQLRASSMP